VPARVLLALVARARAPALIREPTMKVPTRQPLFAPGRRVTFAALVLALALVVIDGCGTSGPGAAGPGPEAGAGAGGADAGAPRESGVDVGLASDTGLGGPLDAGATRDADAAADAAGDAGPLSPIDRSTATIYSVFPEIYASAGNLAAVTADLPRVRGLGFDVLYLLPVTPVGQPTGSHPAFGSPYCVHDYEAINPAFGAEGDLTALVQAAHALGMHVMLDEVLNHTAWDNPLVTQHPEYYLHSDGNPQNVGSIEQAFTYADVAQLDYKTPGNGLAAYMAGMLTSWIQKYDIDGFRFDTADDPYGAGRMIPASFWQGLRPQLEAVKPGILMLGEEEDPDLADAPFELDYGWALQGLYGAGGLRQVATGSDASLLQQAWSSQQTGYPQGMRHMTLLQDWDLDEDLTLYGGAPNTMAAATFAFTIDGLPLLFAGEEVGNDHSGVNTHTAIDWTGPNAAAFSAFYGSLLALRNGNPALQQGSVTWVSTTAATHVVSYTRSDANATFLVLINFSSAAVTGTVSAPASSGWTDVSPTGSPGGLAHVQPPTLSLAAYDFAVFRAK
jgi:glycosidase